MLDVEVARYPPKDFNGLVSGSGIQREEFRPILLRAALAANSRNAGTLERRLQVDVEFAVKVCNELVGLLLFALATSPSSPGTSFLEILSSCRTSR